MNNVNKINLPPVIALMGNKGAGKNEAAKAILKTLEKYNLSGKVDSFAAPIREMLKVIVDVDAIYKEGTKETKELYPGVTLRKMMQTLGTDWARGISEDIWVKAMEDRHIDHLLFRNSDYDTLIIDDLRYENEFKLVEFHKGLIIHIESATGSITDTHSSESLPLHLIGDNYKYTVINNYDSDFYLDIEGIIESLLFSLEK